MGEFDLAIGGDLAIAQKTFAKVIVIGNTHLERRDVALGTVYVQDRVWAAIERASWLPSKLGNRTLMGDILKSLSGNVIGVSNGVSNEADENTWDTCGPTSIEE